jgi:hypothetical protein
MPVTSVLLIASLNENRKSIGIAIVLTEEQSKAAILNDATNFAIKLSDVADDSY